ncbi:MAG: tRNA (guanosine(37)-N1)-methyltransferase TrmD [Bdellovibrionota bacterium]
MSALSIDVCTLFPELVKPFLDGSIIGKARNKGLVRLSVHNIRDHAPPPHQVTDDAPYGGGGGMVLKVEPVVKCIRSLPDFSGNTQVLVTAARGAPWKDSDARQLADRGGHTVILCGRYEGIDQRVVDLLNAREVSIGDFVMSGGEAAAVAILDSIVRLVPGATGDESARESDSYKDLLLEHPHYTRPEEFEGKKVPEVLLSGDHARIARWRRRESLDHTWRARPELLEEALAKGFLSEEDLELLAELGHPAGKARKRRR